MLKKIIKISYFLFPIFLLVIFAVDLFSYYSNLNITPIFFLRELVIITISLLIFYIIKNKLHFDELSIQQNLIRLGILIAINLIFAIFLNLFFNPIYSTSFPPTYESANAIIVSTITAILAAFTLIPALFILKQLIFYKRKRYTAVFFNLFLISIIASALSVYITEQPIGWLRFSIETLPNDLIFMVIIFFTIILAFRNQWITYLSRKKKIVYFFIGILFIIATGSLFDLAYQQALPAYSLSITALIFGMWFLLIVYSGCSLIKLLFYLPAAHAIDRKIKEINSLYDLGRILSSETKVDVLIPLITKLTLQVLESNSSWLVLYNNKEKSDVVAHINLSESELNSISSTKLNELNKVIIESKHALLINDVYHNRQFKDLLLWKKDARTVLGAPLFNNRGKLMGLICSTKIREYTFDIDDISLIQGFANQAAIALENAMLLQKSIEKERLEQELEIARSVQLKLLPQSIPQIINFDIEAYYLSAYEVGGDYYDFITYEDKQPGIIIGDVSGKGTSAALYMAEFKGIVQTLAKNHKSPASLAKATNSIMFPNIERNSFISAIFLKINTDQQSISFARAGHTPVIYCIGNGAEPQNILTKGLGIGLDPGKKFNKFIEEETISLNTTGTMLLYTDGLTEARNEKGKEFGEDRLMKLIWSCTKETAVEVKNKLIDSVLNFCGNTPLHDDLTFVILRNNQDNPK